MSSWKRPGKLIPTTMRLRAHDADDVDGAADAVEKAKHRMLQQRRPSPMTSIQTSQNPMTFQKSCLTTISLRLHGPLPRNAPPDVTAPNGPQHQHVRNGRNARQDLHDPKDPKGRDTAGRNLSPKSSPKRRRKQTWLLTTRRNPNHAGGADDVVAVVEAADAVERHRQNPPNLCHRTSV